APNTVAGDDAGFAARPGGHRGHVNNDIFNDLHDIGHWWTATESSPRSAHFYLLLYNRAAIFRGTYPKKVAFSVRCVRD
ncbi:MAG TPA: FISUMP domain-containing protein, partial [Patescibacteria group bacterium]|nr:FISUMP domain-containing protein [Patescibacteria group bacterium]